MIFTDQQITRRMRKWVAGEHFRYARFADAQPAPDEVDLSAGVILEIAAPRSPLLDQMERDCLVNIESLKGREQGQHQE